MRAEPLSRVFRASLRALWSQKLVSPGSSSHKPAVDAALAAVEDAGGAANKAEPESAHKSEERGFYNTEFEIVAQLAVPSTGYGLTAVSRFIVTFGRRRHTNMVPFALLFGRAASAGSD